MFKSSLVSASNPSQVFAELSLFCSSGWSTHWLVNLCERQIVKVFAFYRENCGTLIKKQMRTLYRRPSSIPAMIELSKPSWILLSGSSEAVKVRHKNQTFKQVKATNSPMLYYEFIIYNISNYQCNERVSFSRSTQWRQFTVCLINFLK